MKYYSSKTVTKILGVTAQTLRNCDKAIEELEKKKEDFQIIKQK